VLRRPPSSTLPPLEQLLADPGLDETQPVKDGLAIPRHEALAGDVREPPERRTTMGHMAVAPKKLDLHDGDVVEIEGRRYDVVPDKQGGLTLEPAITVTMAELDRRHGTRPATQQEIDDQLPGLLPPDGEG
jgi:hypothetical protein